MSDLIRKRSATERLIIAKTLLDSVLQDMPTAEPEIIRCKDCVAYGESLPQVDKRMICHKWAINFPEDFYCAVAERRTDEHTDKHGDAEKL